MSSFQTEPHGVAVRSVPTLRLHSAAADSAGIQGRATLTVKHGCPPWVLVTIDADTTIIYTTRAIDSTAG